MEELAFSKTSRTFLVHVTLIYRSQLNHQTSGSLGKMAILGEF